MTLLGPGACVPRGRFRQPVRRGPLKKLYRGERSDTDAVRVCLQALYDAADDDSATSGRISPAAYSQWFTVDSRGVRLAS